MIQNKDIIVAKNDKGVVIVIIKKLDYVTKFDNMIDEGIMERIYRNYWKQVKITIVILGLSW